MSEKISNNNLETLTPYKKTPFVKSTVLTVDVPFRPEADIGFSLHMYPYRLGSSI